MSAIGLLFALKVKAILVTLAIVGGTVLGVKFLVALLLPLISGYTKNCFKDHGHVYHHEFEYEPPYHGKVGEAELEDYPGPYYKTKRRTRTKRMIF